MYYVQRVCIKILFSRGQFNTFGTVGHELSLNVFPLGDVLSNWVYKVVWDPAPASVTATTGTAANLAAENVLPFTCASWRTPPWALTHVVHRLCSATTCCPDFGSKSIEHARKLRRLEHLSMLRGQNQPLKYHGVYFTTSHTCEST